MTIVVELSREKELSGYDITSQVKRLGLSASPGTIYNQFRRLEKEGIIKSRLVPHGTTYKAVYKATEEGKRILQDFTDKWDPIFMQQHIIARAKKQETPVQ